MSQYYHYGTANLPKDEDKRRREMKRRRDKAKKSDKKSHSGIEESSGMVGKAARHINKRKYKLSKYGN